MPLSMNLALHSTICFLYVQRNVKDMMRKCSIPTHISADIINDIFGKKIGSTYVEGLVNASDSIVFQEKLEKILEKGEIYPYLLRPIWRG